MRTTDNTLSHGLRTLSERQCWSRLGESGAGRVAYLVGSTPVVTPVNFVIAEAASVWFWATSYSGVAVHVAGQVVSFEADDYNIEERSGWSVLVRGRAQHAPVAMPEAPQGLLYRSIGAAAGPVTVFRVDVRSISGREIGPTEVEPGSSEPRAPSPQEPGLVPSPRGSTRTGTEARDVELGPALVLTLAEKFTLGPRPTRPALSATSTDSSRNGRPRLSLGENGFEERQVGDRWIIRTYVEDLVPGRDLDLVLGEQTLLLNTRGNFVPRLHQVFSVPVGLRAEDVTVAYSDEVLTVAMPVRTRRGAQRSR